MNIASYIDHTLLKPTATEADIRKLYEEAIDNEFAAVCVPPCYVAVAKHLLEGSTVKVATVVGFPMGYQALEPKLAEIVAAIQAGADELDMVHNIAAIKSGNWDYVEREVALCTNITHQMGKQIKVIVESGLLTEDELIRCCALYALQNVDFIKTSTGYAEVSATVDAVSIIKAAIPDHIAIKASGGIRTFAFAKELIEAGATRIGTSAGVQIVQQSK